MSERKMQIPSLEQTLREPEKIKNDPVSLFIEQMVEQFPKFKQSEENNADFSYLSPEQRAESLWALFQEVKGIVSGRKGKEKGVEVKKMQRKVQFLVNLYNDPETRKAYLGAVEKQHIEIDSINGNYEKYQTLDKHITVAETAFDASARELFAGRSGGTDESDTLLFETNKRQLSRLRGELATLTETNPELSALVHYETLRQYSTEFRQENFIWSPSRRASLEEIELAALSGKPVLLSGESGTGKTRLVEQTALKLTGRVNNETPGKDVRFQDLIAKPKIAADGRTYYEYKEIGEAVTGKTNTLEKEPAHEGRLVADDEFNLLASAEQTERLARISNWTPGKHVRMPVTNEEITVASDFLYCAMVNLASQRYERKKIPPEVLRKFAKVDLDYPPQTGEDPEIYEMLLAALIDENGRMRAALDEVAPGYTYKEEKKTIKRDGQAVKANMQTRELMPGSDDGFLWRFANALNELNKSFSHRETALKAKGEGQYVKDLIIDIGTVLGWLKEYGSLGRTKSLETFIKEKIKTQFLDRAAYSDEDRKLVREFLKHFLIDVDRSVTGRERSFKNLTAMEIGLLSPRVKYEKVLAEEPEMTEGYLVNEEGERIEYYIIPFELNGVRYSPDPKASTGHFIKHADGEVYEFLGVTKETSEPVLSLYKPKAKTPEKSRKNENEVSLERAAEIFGSEFFGPEAVEATFDVRFDTKDIPKISFSEIELERAQELGQLLILRVDKTADGRPLTMEKLHSLLQSKFDSEKAGKILASTDWYKNEDFFKQEVPQLRWALVTKEVVPNSTNQNFVDQTATLANYLRNEVFKGGTLPREYQEAIEEFEKQKAKFGKITDKNWEEIAKKLSELKLNKLTRHTPVEVLYDMVVRFASSPSKDRLLEKMYTWTPRLSSAGKLVRVGDFDAAGAYVLSSRPDHAYDSLGVSFSRSH